MDKETALLSLNKAFDRVFGEGGRRVSVIAPGRINLIGEHTDYNEGFVFPMAIDFSIYLIARRNPNKSVRIYSVDYDEEVEFSLDMPVPLDFMHRWSNYLRGIFRMLQESGREISGAEIVFTGNIPQGSGLSSSAALGVATALALQALNSFSIQPKELALLCQRAENEFVGIKCGIMDQFVSLFGRQEHALLLDCRSLEYEYVPLILDEYRLLICHSGVSHTLVDSAYNQRRIECEHGLEMISRKYPEVKSLRDASIEQLDVSRCRMEPAVYLRCRHVISENNRVLESVAALNAGNMEGFGRLMNESHNSLRDDYEVSCKEIDLLVDLAREVPGVSGSRITGGGFGGCTVSLVHKSSVEKLSRHIMEVYPQRTGITPCIYWSLPADGAKIID
jgi:galactokinase